MKKLARQWLSCLPGVGASLGIAVVATLLADLLDKLLGTHLIGAAVIAMFIGMGVNAVRKPGKLLTPGLKFTSKKLLKFAIILLGASLSIDVILDVGRMSLLVMVFTLATCFGLGYFSGRALGLNWKMSNLISAGTGICGGSAIAAIAPTIVADDTDVAFAMSATFLFDMAMILLFPLMGRAMGLSDQAFGLWAGTAVNDTSSVVATGYAFSEAAGDFATMVKLTRTLCIVPTVIIFALISVRLKRREALAQGSTQEIRANVSIAKIFPWFILGFVAMACLKSLGCIPDSVSAVMKDVSKFLMVAALAAIGMNTSFATMRKSGARPMLHGFIISALVVIVAIAVEYAMHLMGWLELFAPAA